jgi:hypothetical protein
MQNATSVHELAASQRARPSSTSNREKEPPSGSESRSRVVLVLVGGGRHDGNLAKTCHFALLAMQCGALLVLRVAMHSLLGLFISDHGQDWQEERVKFRSISNRENVAVTCMSTPTIERSRSMRCLSNHFRPVNNVL